MCKMAKETPRMRAKSYFPFQVRMCLVILVLAMHHISYSKMTKQSICICFKGVLQCTSCNLLANPPFSRLYLLKLIYTLQVYNINKNSAGTPSIPFYLFMRILILEFDCLEGMHGEREWVSENVIINFVCFLHSFFSSLMLNFCWTWVQVLFAFPYCYLTLHGWRQKMAVWTILLTAKIIVIWILKIVKCAKWRNIVPPTFLFTSTLSALRFPSLWRHHRQPLFLSHRQFPLFPWAMKIVVAVAKAGIPVHNDYCYFAIAAWKAVASVVWQGKLKSE